MRTNIFHQIYKEMDNSKFIPKFPYLIDIELTNKCNLDCPFCSRQIMTRKQGFMSDATFEKILNEIEDIKIPVRFIRWGEPFLHPNIIKYALQITERGIPLHITTNGLILKKEIIYCDVNSIIFSMQGTNKKEYESSRIGGNYGIFKQNILDLVKYRGSDEKPYISITTTLGKEQGTNKEKFIKYWKKYVDDVRVGNTIMARFGNKIIPNESHQICREPFKQLSIDWDGKVTACCSDYDNLMTIGDINKQSLYEIWNENPVLEGIRNIFNADYYNYFTLCSKCIRGHKQ